MEEAANSEDNPHEVEAAALLADATIYHAYLTFEEPKNVRDALSGPQMVPRMVQGHYV